MSSRALFAWSLRRELWENRAIYLAPLTVAAFALAAFVYHIIRTVSKPALAADLAKQAAAMAIPYGIAASVILLTCWIVGIFYAIDALYGERRDRSILFWKSMPVSDFVTVAAKAVMPILVIPAVAFAIALATQLLMMLASVAVYAASGRDVALAWNAWPLARQTVVMAYGTAIHALWFAPIFAWLLLVSGWVRRAPLLWAIVPFIGASLLEKIALGSSFVDSVIRYRIVGAMSEGFARGALKQPTTELSQLDPGRFFSNPHLWIGLAVAGALIALAVRLRRYREPT